MSTRLGKFSSLRDEVVYRASLEFPDDTIGDVQDYGMFHALVLDFYGKDYVVTENSVGFVDVEAFDAYFMENGRLFRSAEARNCMLELSDAYDAWRAGLDDEECDS